MILRLVIGIIVIYFVYKLIKGWKAIGGGAAKGKQPVSGEDLVEDPLCHTYVPLGDACRTTIDGKTFFFCSEKCRDRYIEGKNR